MIDAVEVCLHETRVGLSIQSEDGGAGSTETVDVLVDEQVVVRAVVSVLRRQLRQGELNDRRAAQALSDLTSLPLQRASHLPLLDRCWELTDNLTVYDAAYVALAEALATTLLTGDARLSRSTGPRCPIETFRSTT